MAESTIVKTKRDGTLTFDDGTTPTPLTYEVAFEAGDLSLTIPGRTVNLFLDRGVMNDPPQIRYGDDQPITGTFTAQLRDTSDAAVATLLDILNQTGYVGSTWVSRTGANAEVFTVRLTWVIEGTDLGDANDHSIELDHCYVTGSVADGDPGTVTINFTSYVVYPTVV
jgi:hypothetical protein